ncbi:hypothetical protein HB825_05305 [Listeria booriae]|uniref:Uncharacterized protein n=3 Tax=Listeria TaxID=1637 RepID=A0A7X1CXK2_9LIST|nr:MULTISPECIES: hypothetical protein [Listeria]EUJ43395.1 hypothetical protein PRIP_13794 [Listeria riparia FSL S10-1204]MBC1490619.1 hypothetical protein [Listeria booriae]MBC1503844.1 hypothetical protein [Listeria booriae]MBC1512214.1 hypothetical protein [Listeria booriae]MBC1524901.1 hypothetical protein [Listeria booriae]
MDKLDLLKEQYLVILKEMTRYGSSSNRPQIRQIKNILEFIDDVKNGEITDEVFEELRRMNDSLYPPHGGLGEFYIWADDFDERMKLNEPLDKARDFTWNTLNA